jgi:carbon-monoxide dehydrogenase large subunit
MKGMGEGGLIGGPSAIVNAISDALGVPVDRTPLRPCDVLELVNRASRAPS